jgi:hypothetical protein
MKGPASVFGAAEAGSLSALSPGPIVALKEIRSVPLLI